MIHWGLRRDEICDDTVWLCPESPEPGVRCDDCGLSKLERFETTWGGELLLRTNDLRCALAAGVAVTLDEIPFPEFCAMRMIEDEIAKWEKEKSRER